MTTCPRCGTPSDTDLCFQCGRHLDALTKGHVLAGRYEVKGLLGKGGMGVVYEARDRKLQATVAVKVLRQDLAQRFPDLSQRFQNEIRLARRVRHKNVCAIHEYGEDGDRVFIVMEYVDGINLKQLLQENALQPTEACRVVSQVADGLQAIHDVDVVHRDVKTSNLMRDSSGLVRLMDFGIAKDLSVGAEALTGNNTILGTLEYCSPEQAQGLKLDRRSDIYSLGVVLFELLTRELPFRAPDPVRMLLMQMSEPPKLERIPDLLRPIVERALAKQPEDRFQSASEMAQALQRVLPLLGDATTAKAAAVPPGRTLIAWRRRDETIALRGRKPFLLVASLAAIAVGSASGVILWRQRQTPAPMTATARTDPTLASPLPTATIAAASATAEPTEANDVPVTTAAGPTLPPVISSTRPTAIAQRLNEEKPTDVPTAPSAAPTEPSRAIATNDVAVIAAPTTSTVVEPPHDRAAPSPPATTPAHEPEASATLRLHVRPWAEIQLDGLPKGRVESLTVSPGKHVLVFNHPDYEPYKRGIAVESGQTRDISVDMREDAIRRR